MVCSLEKEGVFNPQKSRIKIFQDRARGLDISSVCQRCDPAPCVDICPAGALRKDANNETVVLDGSICIGEKCLECSKACPYGAITWDVLGETLICCDLCGGDPECVKYCKPRVLLFEECDPIEIQQQRDDLEKLIRPFLNVKVAKAREN